MYDPEKQVLLDRRGDGPEARLCVKLVSLACAASGILAIVLGAALVEQSDGRFTSKVTEDMVIGAVLLLCALAILVAASRRQVPPIAPNTSTDNATMGSGKAEVAGESVYNPSV